MAKDIEPIDDLSPDEEAMLDGRSLVAGAAVGARFDGRFGERLGVLRRKLVAGLVKKGIDREDAIETVGKLGDGHLIELLIKYGPDIMKMILALLPLFI